MAADELSRQYARAVLDALVAYNREALAEAGRLEADGWRLVGGGAVTQDHETGETSWEITDWRTGEVIAAGTGLEAYDRADARLGKALHIDHILEGAPPDLPDPPEGLPGTLAEAIALWVSETHTGEDVAAWTGWEIDRVRHARADWTSLGRRAGATA